MAAIDDRPPRSGKRGRVTMTRTAWCADCGGRMKATEDSTSERAQAEWMAFGWVWTKRLGWLCDACYRGRVREAAAPAAAAGPAARRDGG